MQHNTETKIWNATLYLRLSRDDGDKEESNSITGQRELLRDFIRTRPELREYAVRIDDGFTGSNFERPSFKKMLEDVKAGRTNCIIVKDMSRLGRDYLGVGYYTDTFFPEHNIRFIAVNDCVDSDDGENELAPFRNVMKNIDYLGKVFCKFSLFRQIYVYQSLFVSSLSGINACPARRLEVSCSGISYTSPTNR